MMNGHSMIQGASMKIMHLLLLENFLYAPCITITLWYMFHNVFVYAFWKNMDIESRKANSIDERTQSTNTIICD